VGDSETFNSEEAFGVDWTRIVMFSLTQMSTDVISQRIWSPSLKKSATYSRSDYSFSRNKLLASSVLFNCLERILASKIGGKLMGLRLKKFLFELRPGWSPELLLLPILGSC
jgi:hypothetical protein